MLHFSRVWRQSNTCSRVEQHQDIHWPAGTPQANSSSRLLKMLSYLSPHHWSWDLRDQPLHPRRHLYFQFRVFWCTLTARHTSLPQIKFLLFCHTNPGELQSSNPSQETLIRLKHSLGMAGSFPGALPNWKDRFTEPLTALQQAVKQFLIDPSCLWALSPPYCRGVTRHL